MTCPHCGGPLVPCPMADVGVCAGTVHQVTRMHGCGDPRDGYVAWWRSAVAASDSPVQVAGDG